MSRALKATLFFICLALPRSASPHAYGLSSVDRHMSLKCKGKELILYYVENIGEIPSTAEIARYDANRNNTLDEPERQKFLSERRTKLSSRIQVKINGDEVNLICTEGYMSIRKGDMNLPNIITAYRCGALVGKCPTDPGTVYIKDNWLAGTPGKKSITLNLEGGKNAGVTYRFGGYEIPEVKNRKRSVRYFIKEKITSYLSGSLTPWKLILLLILSFILGVFHSLSPGHGKSLIATYFLGKRGTIKEGFYLSLSLIISHTSSIYLLALVFILLQKASSISYLNRALEMASGIGVVLIGVYLLYSRLLSPDPAAEHHHHREGSTGAAFLGLSYGLAPCPTGLALYLACASAGKPVTGIFALLSFSAGLGGVILTLSIVMVKGGNKLLGKIFEGREKLIKAISVASALVITMLGLIVILRRV